MADDGKRLNGEGLTQVWQSMQAYVQDNIQDGGTVKCVTASEGLEGGVITEAGTISLKPASNNELGGVKVSYDSGNGILSLYNDSSTKTSKAVNFYDYDGTIVYSYEKTEFLNRNSLPANPTHEGLTSQGWNWSLADAQDYMSRHDILDIGQNYITSDGKTRIYVDIDENSLASTLSLYCEDIDTWVEVNWGDGSIADSLISEMTGYLSVDHLYDNPGEYIITIEVKNNHNVYIPGTDFSEGSYTDRNRMSHLFNFLGIPSPFSNKVKKIEIGSHITKIQSCGLERMYGLETITIPNSVIDIGDDAFAYDTSLKAIIFPKNITSHELNKEMLIEPYSLEVICIPNGITYIGGFFLYDTKKLKRLCLPDTIIGNDYNSFCVYNANSLEEASFPITLSSIELGNCTFGGATSGLSLKLKQFNLEDINIEMIDTYTFHESKLKNIILPQSCTEIQDNAFSYCYDMETFIMPDTVTTLGGACFVGCESLKYIYLSANLTEIPSSCFNWCTNLKNLNIPSSVITIGHGAFDSSGLEVIELPNTVQAIGISAFADCNNLIKVKMSKNISAIPAQCFHYTPNLKLIDCLEYDTVPDLANINAFGQEIPIDYYIVVPDELYSEWIAATNWSDASVVSHIISKTNYEMNASNVPLFEHDDSTPEPFPISD